MRGDDVKPSQSNMAGLFAAFVKVAGFSELQHRFGLALLPKCFLHSCPCAMQPADNICTAARGSDHPEGLVLTFSRQSRVESPFSDPAAAPEAEPPLRDVPSDLN